MTQQQSAANARWENAPVRAVKPCVRCLHSLGFGMTHISKATRLGKSGVHRIVKGLERVHDKRGIAKRRANERQKPIRERNAQARDALKAQRAQKPKPTKEQIKARAAARAKTRYATDVQYMMRVRLRKRIRKTLGEAKASQRTQDIIGCDYETLKHHIESQFERGMGWHNRDRWHIDHIIPCASFDLTNPSQVRACHHFTNLRPMWSRLNIRKGSRVIACQPQLLLTHVK